MASASSGLPSRRESIESASAAGRALIASHPISNNVAAAASGGEGGADAPPPPSARLSAAASVSGPYSPDDVAAAAREAPSGSARLLEDGPQAGDSDGDWRNPAGSAGSSLAGGGSAMRTGSYAGSFLSASEVAAAAGGALRSPSSGSRPTVLGMPPPLAALPWQQPMGLVSPPASPAAADVRRAALAAAAAATEAAAAQRLSSPPARDSPALVELRRIAARMSELSSPSQHALEPAPLAPPPVLWPPRSASAASTGSQPPRPQARPATPLAGFGARQVLSPRPSTATAMHALSGAVLGGAPLPLCSPTVASSPRPPSASPRLQTLPSHPLSHAAPLSTLGWAQGACKREGLSGAAAALRRAHLWRPRTLSFLTVDLSAPQLPSGPAVTHAVERRGGLDVLLLSVTAARPTGAPTGAPTHGGAGITSGLDGPSQPPPRPASSEDAFLGHVRAHSRSPSSSTGNATLFAVFPKRRTPLPPGTYAGLAPAHVPRIREAAAAAAQRDTVVDGGGGAHSPTAMGAGSPTARPQTAEEDMPLASLAAGAGLGGEADGGSPAAGRPSRSTLHAAEIAYAQLYRFELSVEGAAAVREAPTDGAPSPRASTLHLPHGLKPPMTSHHRTALLRQAAAAAQLEADELPQSTAARLAGASPVSGARRPPRSPRQPESPQPPFVTTVRPLDAVHAAVAALQRGNSVDVGAGARSPHPRLALPAASPGSAGSPFWSPRTTYRNPGSPLSNPARCAPAAARAIARCAALHSLATFWHAA